MFNRTKFHNQKWLNRFVGIVISLLLFRVAFGQGFGGLVPQPVPQSLVIPYQRQQGIASNGSIPLNITIAGSQDSSCKGIPQKPVDVMLVYDISASAGVGAGSNWDKTIQITQELFTQFGRPIYSSPTSIAEASQFGIITSSVITTGIAPVLIQALTSDISVLESQIVSIRVGDDTDLAAGLELAGQELGAVRIPEREQAIVLMLHDNAGALAMKDVVAELQQQGINVYLIINSLNINTEALFTQILAEDIVDANNIFIDPSADDLIDLFILATDGTQDAAAAVRIQETISPINEVTIQNIGGGGSFQGDNVTWDIERVGFSDRLNLSYDIQTPSTISIGSGIMWLDCNGYPHSTIAGDFLGDGINLTLEPEIVSPSDPASRVAPESTPPTIINAPIDEPASTDLTAWLKERWWLFILLILPLLLLWLWWRNRSAKPTKVAPSYVPKTRPDGGAGGWQAKPVRMGEDMAHGWKMQKIIDSTSGRSLTLRHQKNIVEVIDGSRRIGRAQLDYQHSTVIDPRNGNKQDILLANIIEWQSTELNDIDKKMLLQLENIALTHESSQIFVSQEILNSTAILSTSSYHFQDGVWQKNIRQ